MKCLDENSQLGHVASRSLRRATSPRRARPSSAAATSGSAASTRRERRPRASGWSSCSIPARSSRSTSSSSTRATTSAWQEPAGPRRRGGDGLRAHPRPARSSSSPRTSPSSAARSSEAYARKICKIMDLAMKTGAPVIGLNDSGGARIQEGVVSLAGYADIFLRNTLASGVVPQISAIMGPCAGGAVYSPAITDFILMVQEHLVHVRDRARRHPGGDARDGVRRGAGRRRTAHGTTSGVAHFAADSEEECLALIRELLTFLPPEQPGGPAAAAHPRPARPAGRDPADDRAGAAEQAVRHEGRHPHACWTTTTSSRCTRPTRPTSSSASAASTGARWASWPTSPRTWPAVSTSTPRSRGPASCASATASTSRSSPSRTCRASCPGRPRSTAGSSSTGPSSSTPSARRPCPS